ncbi:metallophosphoesterase [Peribacillus alkalitolerans]|uniref:metallophosphoesterase n=1 Tax=Peribacillus alkalitolerans TaxID=1550385 RepID=UPI0013D41872|nr:metallophosphoesterase [Peribacillus alkalitolerans]
MLKIEKVNINHEKRTIILSDIHGDLQLLERHLCKIEYTEQDVLFINGDMCEKGPNSMGVVRYIMELMSKSLKVHVSQGNCDVLIQYVLNEDERILNYMRKQKHSILNEMLEEQGKCLDDFLSIKDLHAFYQEHYSKEINWLLDLPVAFETEDFIIIHAGIDNIENWQETSLECALSVPSFYEKGHQASKLVVVGHWPVINYRASAISNNNPLIDLDKRMICIDGGNQIKSDGQLNALIVENGFFAYTYVDHLEEIVIVQKSYVASGGFAGTVTYPNYQLKQIVEEEYFTLCENVNLGIQQWVKNEYIIEKVDGTFCKDDLSTTLLSVDVGDEVSIIDNSCDGYVLIKKNGEVGWIPRDCVS